MKFYQHDAPATFRFVLFGDLAGASAVELEQAWTTAKSTMSGKRLIVDIAGLGSADETGLALLERFRDAGALFVVGFQSEPSAIAASLQIQSGPTLDPRHDRDESHENGRGASLTWRLRSYLGIE